jgi:hypothetical protein
MATALVDDDHYRSGVDLAAARARHTVAGSLAKEAADAVPQIAKGDATLITTLDHAVTGLFRDLSAAYFELASLDALAIERILTKAER